LANEIEFSKNYIFLIQTRFGNDYDFSIKQNIAIKDKFIPTGALQILLENVVKHNKADEKFIQTSITINNDFLTIKNNKLNNPNKESLGTGLQNLKARYQLLSDKKIDIKESNNFFSISIPIINLIDEN